MTALYFVRGPLSQGDLRQSVVIRPTAGRLKITWTLSHVLAFLVHSLSFVLFISHYTVFKVLAVSRSGPWAARSWQLVYNSTSSPLCQHFFLNFFWAFFNAPPLPIFPLFACVFSRCLQHFANMLSNYILKYIGVFSIFFSALYC